MLHPSASLAREVHHAWCGPSLLVVDPKGGANGGLGGWYFRQTRFLRQLRLLIDGAEPFACSVAELSPAELEATFLHPEVRSGGGGGSGSGGTPSGGGRLLFRNLDLRLRYRVRPASLEVTAYLTSRWQDALELAIAWQLDADYATIDQAMFDDAAASPGAASEPAEGGVRFRCVDCGLPLATLVSARPDWRFEAGQLVTKVTLERQQTRVLGLVVRAVDGSDPIDEPAERRREERLASWRGSRMTLHAAAETPFVEIAERAAEDLGSLALLEGPADEWLTPGAGIPLYQSLWARDALTATWQSGLIDRGDMLEDVLDRLTRQQGRVDDAARDEQPGRILNQAKTDLRSRTGRTGFDLNYADVASPFMYLIGLGYHYMLTGDRGYVAARYDAALRVADWARRQGDLDGDGYVEYLTVSPNGPTHQGWKDSENAVVDERGHQIRPPIAACEIQGYRYVGLQFLALFALVMGEVRRSTDLWHEAAALKERFNRDFWLEEEGFLAFGLGPDKRPIRALTSNAAQCLATGIVAAEHVPRLVRRMFEPDLFSGWGIRTLSTTNPAYNPLDYHLGSVWPVENASIVFGLRRYGLSDRVHQLVTGLYDLARLWPDGRTPECVGGYGREEAGHPGAYPRANRPQTWNQSAWPLLTQCLLGFVPLAPLDALLVDPVLPPWLPELTVSRLRVGDAVATLRFERDADGRTHFHVLERKGSLRVIEQPWLESFSTDSWERLAMLARSAVSHVTR